MNTFIRFRKKSFLILELLILIVMTLILLHNYSYIYPKYISLIFFFKIRSNELFIFNSDIKKVLLFKASICLLELW